MSALSLLLGVRPTLATEFGSFEPGLAAARPPSVGGVAGAEAAGASRSFAPGSGRRQQPVDTVTFSPESLEAAARLEAKEAIASERGGEQAAEPARNQSEADETRSGDGAISAEDSSEAEGERRDEEERVGAPRGADGEPLSDSEVEQVRELQARDLEVRQHEQAHVAAGGPYVTSGPTYQYQRGPDGKRYAVGGNVGIDVSAEDTPEKTIAKAQVVRQAALAPAEPSAQDLRVAAQASRLEQRARAELSEQQREETESESTDADSTDPQGRRRNTEPRASTDPA